MYYSKTVVWNKVMPTSLKKCKIIEKKKLRKNSTGKMLSYICIQTEVCCMCAVTNSVNRKSFEDQAQFCSKYSPHYLKCKFCYGSGSFGVVWFLGIYRQRNLLKDMAFQFARSFGVLFSFPDDPSLSVRKCLQKIKI